mmetsp:Transcript_7816/g.11228  ORF Transcript_7816/g.11228 Transcript_7816/m.11228 type:complete len:174 (-) Transcript_7816:175-696(-)
MVLTYLFEKMGLWDFFAPQNRTSKRQKKEQRKANENNNDVESATTPGPERHPQQQEDEVDPETRIRRMQLNSQREREIQAESRNAYVKKQRVKYHYRAMDSWHDAVILGVHLDDGPDKPYYTIKYQKADVTMDEQGNEVASLVEVEKQTTPDRLQRVPWNENATWAILSQNKA